MTCTTEKEFINSAYTNIRDFSFKEKRSEMLDEEKINSFLDSINRFKKSLKAKTSKIDRINEGFEKLTWFNNIDEECLQLINDLISSAKDLRSSLIRQYVSMNQIRSKNIAKEEMKNFKTSLDELKESYEDLESVFFFLPEMTDFKETTKMLSLI